ncbi:MAG TPA: FCD domain-containing protein [Eoetvoesiella sp.]
MSDLIAGKGIRAEGAKELARFLLEEMTAGRLREGVKLPPERELSKRFGASRGAVRRVLSEFRERGLITQSVGSGTFASAAAHTLSLSNTSAGDSLNTSPAELMEARLLIEPLMPALIARNATGPDFVRMLQCLEESEAAKSIEEFEHWDGELHEAFAVATHNAFFLQILELTNRVREQGEWGRLKRVSLTSERRKQYEQQHRAIVAALKDRDAAQASALLFRHLEQVQKNLFQTDN